MATPKALSLLPPADDTASVVCLSTITHRYPLRLSSNDDTPYTDYQGMTHDQLVSHFIAKALDGEATPPSLLSGAAVKKNSYTPSAAQSSASDSR